MAEAEHLKLQGQEEKASYLVAQCTLHAPAAATVQEIHVAPFEKVEQDAPLLTVVSAKNLQIEFEVPASLAGKLSVGTKLELSVDEINQNHTIEITSIVPVVNKTTKTFRVIAKTTRDAGLLIPGMTGNVKFSGF